MLSEQDILYTLERNCNFPDPEKGDGLLTAFNFEDRIIDPLKEGIGFQDSWTYEYGASKMCIIFQYLPFVVKIPFMYDEPGLGDAAQEYCSNKFPLGHLLEGKYTWDYCAIESSYYEASFEYGVEDLFAKEMCIGYINNYPIYIQTKVTPLADIDSRSLKESSQDTYDKVKSITKEKNRYIDADMDWIANVFAYYGETTFRNLLQFLSDYDINDLHNGNVGYVGEAPVFLDYSSFDGF